MAHSSLRHLCGFSEYTADLFPLGFLPSASPSLVSNAEFLNSFDNHIAPEELSCSLDPENLLLSVFSFKKKNKTKKTQFSHQTKGLGCSSVGGVCLTWKEPEFHPHHQIETGHGGRHLLIFSSTWEVETGGPGV